jgi:hypothetical protein
MAQLLLKMSECLTVFREVVAEYEFVYGHYAGKVEISIFIAETQTP